MKFNEEIERRFGIKRHKPFADREFTQVEVLGQLTKEQLIALVIDYASSYAACAKALNGSRDRARNAERDARKYRGLWKAERFKRQESK